MQISSCVYRIRRAIQSELLGERTVAAVVESQVMSVRSRGIKY